jgi:NAD+ kinase
VNPLKSIAFIVNRSKSGAEAIAAELCGQAVSEGLETRTAPHHPVPDGFLDEMDACCVIGGDGTLLGVVSPAVRQQVPVLGVNLGKLGFMASLSEEDAQSKFKTLLAGDYRIDRRTVLSCTAASGDHALALNDIVIKHSSLGLVSIEVLSNRMEVNEYNCDGLIFSTPTGSTAYNLSAGGPIIHPAAQVIALTPICPHTLSNRSVIFDEHTHLTVIPRHNPDSLRIVIDGQRKFESSVEFPLEICVAEQQFLLIQQGDYAHFRLVRNKLLWGDSSI